MVDCHSLVCGWPLLKVATIWTMMMWIVRVVRVMRVVGVMRMVGVMRVRIVAVAASRQAR